MAAAPASEARLDLANAAADALESALVRITEAALADLRTARAEAAQTVTGETADPAGERQPVPEPAAVNGVEPEAVPAELSAAFAAVARLRGVDLSAPSGDAGGEAVEAAEPTDDAGGRLTKLPRLGEEERRGTVELVNALRDRFIAEA